MLQKKEKKKRMEYAIISLVIMPHVICLACVILVIMTCDVCQHPILPHIFFQFIK